VWPVRFTEAARAELIDAQDWYEAEAPGLGRRFRAEIDSVVRRMADNRGNSPPSLRRSSGASAKKFPYALFFLIEPDALLVVACFHSSRDPPPLAKARAKGFGPFPARRTNRS
jgi:plasmid stabilization system protein ParE